MEIDADVKHLIYDSYQKIEREKEGVGWRRIWTVIAEPNSNSMAVTTSVGLCHCLTLSVRVWVSDMMIAEKLWCSIFAGSISSFWRLVYLCILEIDNNRNSNYNSFIKSWSYSFLMLLLLVIMFLNSAFSLIMHNFSIMKITTLLQAANSKTVCACDSPGRLIVFISLYWSSKQDIRSHHSPILSFSAFTV